MRSVLVAFIISATFGALLWGLYQGTQAVLHGDISAGHLGQTVVYVIILVGSVAVISEVYGDLLRAAGATERLMELLDMRSPIASPARPVALPAALGGSSVSLVDVSFRYPSRPKHAALSHFSLEVRPGETVALVGPSGAGKSTVFQLLLRFYDVTSGTVLVDGVSVRSLALGAIARTDRHRAAGQRDLLDQCPREHPLRSAVGHRCRGRGGGQSGVRARLHHGAAGGLPDLPRRARRAPVGRQRQRISIARAMLKNPPLLLLDEATSALDAESERMVQAALESAMKDRTTLVIAHRLSTGASAPTGSS
jgi:ATP-binding cassette subfamily B protein